MKSLHKQAITTTRKAFTLVELLVVISIIALLVSILLPALNKAREQAKLVMCRTNMRSVAMAFHLYADDYDDAIVPGDFMMGHDIWSPATEGPDISLGYGPRNIGHLLVANALPMPESEDHVFYCPNLSNGSKKDINGFRYESDLNEPNPGMRRGFDDGGWGGNRPVNIGYEYRDTIDGDPSAAIYKQAIERNLAKKLAKIKSRSLVCDTVSWGAGKNAHVDKYNYARSDGSAETYTDPGTDGYLYEIYDMFTGSRTGNMQHEDAIFFNLFDEPWRYEEFFGIVAW